MTEPFEADRIVISEGAPTVAVAPAVPDVDIALIAAAFLLLEAA